MSEHDRVAVADLESAIPGDGALLATLKHPFLLDFSARPVFIMSLPAMAGLPPGMPLNGGAEAVAVGAPAGAATQGHDDQLLGEREPSWAVVRSGAAVDEAFGAPGPPAWQPAVIRSS